MNLECLYVWCPLVNATNESADALLSSLGDQECAFRCNCIATRTQPDDLFFYYFFEWIIIRKMRVSDMQNPLTNEWKTCHKTIAAKWKLSNLQMNCRWVRTAFVFHFTNNVLSRPQMMIILLKFFALIYKCACVLRGLREIPKMNEWIFVACETSWKWKSAAVNTLIRFKWWSALSFASCTFHSITNWWHTQTHYTCKLCAL